MSAILGVVRGKAPQSMRREQVLSARVDHRALLFRRKPAFGQRDRENLIRPNRSVVSIRPIENIEAAMCCFIPESRETFSSAFDKTRVSGCRAPQQPRELRHC